MRKLATAVLLVIAIGGALTPASGQTNFPPREPGTTILTPRGSAVTPLGWYVMGSVAVAVVSPMIASAILGRELTLSEAYHVIFGSTLGPVGLLLADVLAPPTVTGNQPAQPRSQRRVTQGRHFNIPPAGATNIVLNEVLLEFAPGTSAQTRDALARTLQMTQLETQTFALTGRTIERWRIDAARSVRDTLRLVSRNFPGVSSGQANMIYRPAQTATKPAGAPDNAAGQYVVQKLHLLEAHRISSGDDVLVAVIDSKIDTAHPDLAGVFAGEYDALGTPGPAHAHGTAMAGAIAAHSKLVGVAPKVKLLAVRTFSGSGEAAQGTTYNILKGLDWAAGKNARIVNMSFAGPPDSLLREMLSKASARGMILIAAVGNAGPKSPPLYPAADAHVIGVTATDADDKLMPQANRGPQVAVAAPGVEILAAAPDGGYQVTSGTSVAAAHATGVAALLLAAKPKLTPAQVRVDLMRSAHRIPGKRNEVGAGVVDALAVIKGTPK